MGGTKSPYVGRKTDAAGSQQQSQAKELAEPLESEQQLQQQQQKVAADAPVVAGWLKKKPIGVGLRKLIGLSQKRWFRLDGPILTYCEDSDPNSAKTKALRLTAQSEVTLNRDKLSFYLVANPTRAKKNKLATLTAQAETDMQLDRW